MAISNSDVKTLKQFYDTIKTNGLRTNHQFQIQFGGSDVPTDLNTYVVYAMSASVPGKTIVTQDTPFYGFPFKVPVNVTYDQTWTMTFRCDTQLKIRAAIEDWSNKYADLAKSTGGSKGKIPTNSYALVHLLDPSFFNDSGSASVSRTYKLVGVFPSTLGNMAQNHGDNGLTTFDVTLAFQYWYPVDADGNGTDPLGDGSE